ncbi:leucyl/phenylalanyl-tRNA--protein transferase [Desulfothermus okinawensis JCM 13304]
MVIYSLPPEPVFPDPLIEDVDDIVAIGGDLSPDRLIVAYKNGIFPWYDEHSPILWWSPDPRLVLRPEDLHVSRRLRRTIRQGKFTVTINYAFEEVINYCSKIKRKGTEGTWLVPEMIEAYTNLHKIGYCHSIEAWSNGRLAGGLYGVCLGKVFFGESMFYQISNASKVAFVWLVLMLKKANFKFIDCQQVTSHLMRFGAKPIKRRIFITELKKALWLTPPQDLWKPKVLSEYIYLIEDI